MSRDAATRHWLIWARSAPAVNWMGSLHPAGESTRPSIHHLCARPSNRCPPPLDALLAALHSLLAVWQHGNLLRLRRQPCGGQGHWHSGGGSTAGRRTLTASPRNAPPRPGRPPTALWLQAVSASPPTGSDLRQEMRLDMRAPARLLLLQGGHRNNSATGLQGGRAELRDGLLWEWIECRERSVQIEARRRLKRRLSLQSWARPEAGVPAGTPAPAAGGVVQSNRPVSALPAWVAYICA